MRTFGKWTSAPPRHVIDFLPDVSLVLPIKWALWYYEDYDGADVDDSSFVGTIHGFLRRFLKWRINRR